MKTKETVVLAGIWAAALMIGNLIAGEIHVESASPIAFQHQPEPNVSEPEKTCRFIQNLKDGKKQTLVAYGTSLTDAGAWVSGLQNALDATYPGLVNVINSGASAKCSIWGLENLQEQVLSKKPDAVFIEFSVNDAYFNYKLTPAECKGNIEAIAARILKENPDCEIILMVMNPMVGIHSERRPELEKFNDTYRDTAKEKGFLLIDHYPAWLKILNSDRKEFDLLVPDGAHPNTEGCRRIVTPNILKAIGIPCTTLVNEIGRAHV